MNQKQMSSAVVVGGLLAVLAIGLFIVLYVVLGSVGLDAAPRLFVSMCVPPAVLALLVGGFALYKRR